jgi:signal recognition particle receptor subunit beta/regulator of replication initiation timing
MVLYNAATRELTAKIVYYGPGLGGKTTNLQLLHDRLDPATVGSLVSLSTQTDRTIYFDLLPVELGEIKGYTIRFQLATVPGQAAFNETRKLVLRGADGIVFVADSRWAMLPKNLESWQNLKDNLKANGLSFETTPIVIQYNKRDLEDILTVEAMQEALGFSTYPSVEAVASAGRGITETFKLVSKLTFVDLLRRLQGRKPEEAAPPAPDFSAAARSGPEAGGPPPDGGALRAGTAPESVGQPTPSPGPAAVPAEALRPAKESFPALEARLGAMSEELARLAAQRGRLARDAGDASAKLSALEKRLDAETAARQTAAREVEASLSSLSARTEKLYQEIASIRRDVEDLESRLQEKTAQGLREAEDIRSQIAPLLEAREEGPGSNREIQAEFDRLRESLADSLAEIAERFRSPLSPREKGRG